MSNGLSFLVFIGLFTFSFVTHGREIQFKKGKITLAGKSLNVEMAETLEQQARGLMFRKTLAEGAGMLFIFPDENIRSFWMKNTFIPLSIGYFNSKKELIDIQDMQPTVSEMEQNPPSYTSQGPAQYALEVPQGWFKKMHIKLKDQLRIQSGP